MEWTNITTSGQQHFSLHVDKSAARNSGRAVLEFKFTTHSSTFPNGTRVSILTPIATLYTLQPVNSVATICDEKDNYRFGFNGQEKVNEVTGLGNHYTALYWEMDSRLGRRWNLDPKPNFSTSNYSMEANNPILMTDPLGDKEFSSYRAYKKELGDNAYSRKEWTGQDGHWLKSDRQNWSAKLFKSNRFTNANDVNIRSSDGYKEYVNLEQREAFYSWFQDATSSRGFETRWAGGAAAAVDKLEWIEGGTGTVAGWLNHSNTEIQDWVRAGNKLIMDDAWLPLQKLYLGKPLTGADARNWDGQMLLREQQTINPSYWQLSNESLSILEGSLRKESLPTKIATFPKFTGSTILSVTDRWIYGMRLMNYKVSKEDVPMPKSCPPNSK